MTYRLGLLVVLLAGCAETKGSGNRIEQAREIPVFTEVVNGTGVNVRINPADGNPNTLTCDDNVVDLIVTEVKQDELRVSLQAGASYVVSVPCVLDVQATVLERVVSNGSGSVEGTGPFQDVSAVNNTGSGGIALDGVLAAGVSVVNSGSGDVTLLDVSATSVTSSSTGSGGTTLEGNATNGSFTLSGAGDIDAGALSLATATVSSSGSGDITLDVSGSVGGSLSGSGDLIVSGGADVNVTTSGSGSVVAP